MGIFDFLTKKKETTLPLPPPPSEPDTPFQGDIEPIRAPAEIQEKPLQKPTPKTQEIPEFEPLPELPPALPAPSPQNRPPQTMPFEEETHEKLIYDKTINPSEDRPIIHTNKPNFIAVDDYRRIITDTNHVRAKLMNAENFARKLTDIKNTEERAFEKWRNYLEDIEKKINFVDQLIAKAQR